ncbi:MAG TPA: EamA family transporter, partial [Candidatus Saccharimonadales bacterium]
MWLALIGFHLVGLVGFNLLLRKSVLNKVDKVTLATVLQTGIAIPAVVLLVARSPQFSIFSPTDLALIASAVLLTIGLQATNVKALQYLEASVFSILYNLRIILTTILGILFLNEAVVWLRISGGIFILLAIIIVKQRGSHLVKTRGIGWGIAAAFVLSFLNLTEKLLINNVGFFNYFPLVSVIAAIIMWTYLLSAKRSVDKGLLLQPKMLQ